jgi:hypothetical protein
MAEQPIRPERITKPIQLLGAWLTGLLSIDVSFLVAATKIEEPSWIAATLVIASIANVPLFLIAVFMLQTRFRPELQEDSYYSTYLTSKTNEPVRIEKHEVQFMELRQRIADLDAKLRAPVPSGSEASRALEGLLVGVNRHLSDGADVAARLKEMGANEVAAFGADEPPSDRVVAISQFLPPNITARLIAVGQELGFKRHTLFDNQAEGTEEHVLFGAYGGGNERAIWSS